MTDRELLNIAIAARDASYCPYSGYAVGAALLTEEGRAYTGVNVENASFGATNCAERTALFTAVAAGERRFTAIAIAGGKQGSDPDASCTPCGICRQVLAEFCPDDTRVITGTRTEISVTTLGALLPEAFRLTGDTQ